MTVETVRTAMVATVIAPRRLLMLSSRQDFWHAMSMTPDVLILNSRMVD
jgi:hypothetical protein